MNLNTADPRVATEQALANANSAGETRWLHMYNGTFWLSSTAVQDAIRIDPIHEVRRRVRSDDGKTCMMIVRTDPHGLTVEFEHMRESLILDVSQGKLRFFMADEHGEVGNDPPFAELEVKCEDPVRSG